MKFSDWIGWGSSLVLLLTLVRQVTTQWKTRAKRGVSRWLFVGQLVASTGFAVYSWLLHNWVFLITNIALLFTAIAGEWIYLFPRGSALQHGGSVVARLTKKRAVRAGN
jgi:uncharacterized protein with PQ loop repeat